jgi:hypothetical protein
MLKMLSTQPMILVVGGLAILLWAHETIAGSCCQEVTSESSCSGCIKVMASPDRYINAGSNSVTECVSSPQTSGCNEAERECVSLTHGNLYSSGCSQVVGTISISLSVVQCDVGTTAPCHVGG